MTTAIRNNDVFNRLDRLNKRAAEDYTSLVARLAVDADSVGDDEILVVRSAAGKSAEQLAYDIDRRQKIDAAMAEREELTAKRIELEMLHAAADDAIVAESETIKRHEIELQAAKSRRHDTHHEFRRAEYAIKKTEQRIAAVLAGDDEPADGAF